MSIREIIFCIAIILWAFCYFTFVMPLAGKNKQLEEEIQQLQAKQTEQDSVIAQLKEEYDALKKKDPAAIEKVLRTKYHFIREGETIATFPPEQQGAAESEGSAKPAE